MFHFLKATSDDSQQWPDKIRNQIKHISEQVADFPTVYQAFNLIVNPADEAYTRTCRIYILDTNLTGDISDRHFFTVSGKILYQDEHGVKLEIELNKYDNLRNALTNTIQGKLTQMIEEDNKRPTVEQVEINEDRLLVSLSRHVGTYAYRKVVLLHQSVEQQPNMRESATFNFKPEQVNL